MRVAALYDVHGNLPALEAVVFPPALRGERTAEEAMEWFESRRGA